MEVLDSKIRENVSLLVAPLHMRIDSETVVQELASDFTRRGFSFTFLCYLLCTHCVLESRINLPRPSSPYKYCVFVCTVYIPRIHRLPHLDHHTPV